MLLHPQSPRIHSAGKSRMPQAHNLRPYCRSEAKQRSSTKAVDAAIKLREIHSDPFSTYTTDRGAQCRSNGRLVICPLPIAPAFARLPRSG